MINDFPNKNSENIVISAPEYHQVVEWLRVKHHIWIVVNIGIPNGGDVMYYANVIKFGTINHKSKHKTNFYYSPSEAYSKAITHILKNYYVRNS